MNNLIEADAYPGGKSKRMPFITASIIGFLLISLVLNIFLYQKNISYEARLAETVLSKPQILSPSPAPTTVPKNSIDDVAAELGVVFAGKAAYKEVSDAYMNINDKNFEVYSGNELDLQIRDRKFTLRIRAYKYSPGLRYENAYEGNTWMMDMDRWLNFHKSAVVGSKNGTVYDDVWGESEVNRVYEVVILGNRKFITYNYGFQPGSAWIHTYQTYDQEKKQFVVIDVTFSGVGKGDDISCYSDVNEVFGQIDGVIGRVE